MLSALHPSLRWATEPGLGRHPRGCSHKDATRALAKLPESSQAGEQTAEPEREPEAGVEGLWGCRKTWELRAEAAVGARGQRTGRRQTERSSASLGRTRPPGLRPGASGARGLPRAWVWGLGAGAFLQALKELTAPHAVEAEQEPPPGLLTRSHPQRFDLGFPSRESLSGQVSEQVSRRACRGARLLLPAPHSPGSRRGPSEQAGTPRESGGDTQAGLFRSGGQLPPSLPPSLRSWSGPSTSAQAQARQAVPVRTAEEAESSQLSSSSSLLMRWKSPLEDPLGHLGDPRGKK